MTTRYNALVVVLEEDIREDDAASIMEAIRHLRGVASVDGNVSEIDSFVTRQRLLLQVEEEIRGVVRRLLSAGSP